MVTKMRGAVLFLQEGRLRERTPAQISQKPPKEVKPKPMDRITDVAIFKVRAKPGLVPPSGFFCLFPPRLLASLLFLRTDKVYVPSRGTQRGVSRATSPWWEEDEVGLNGMTQTKGGHFSLETSSAVATGQVYVDRADWPLFT